MAEIFLNGLMKVPFPKYDLLTGTRENWNPFDK